MTDDVHLLAASYALDALPDDERAFFERHLTTCASCRREVDEFQRTAARLGAAEQEEPPAGMRDAVLAAVDQTRQHAPAVDEDEGTPAGGGAPTPSRYRLLQAVAAVLAAAVLGLGALSGYLAVGGLGEPTLAELLEDAEVVELAGEQGQRATVLYTADDAVLFAEDLEALADDETYQAWVIRDETPVSAGVFASAPDGQARVRLEESVATADAVAVSREAAGGAQNGPEGPIVMIGER